MVVSVVLPHAANLLGWMTAEIGRQPWVVYGLMRTVDGVSPSVSAGEILASLVMFGLIYLLLFVLFIFLLNHKIQHGPLDEDLEPEGHRA
jgi:cytochrome d ubiquinol oxidase subunit I